MKAFAELVVCIGNLGETSKLGLREDEVVDYRKGVADLRDPGEQARTANGQSERRLLEWRTHWCYPSSSQSLSQPILLGALERVALQGGKAGALPAPSVSCCCCCFQFFVSCEFSEPSGPFLPPQEPEPSQDTLEEEPLPPELGVPSQTDKMEE